MQEFFKELIKKLGLDTDPNIEFYHLDKMTIIATFAPNFKKGTPEWKISGIYDFKNKTYSGCQSDFLKFDNWSILDNKLRLGDILNKIYPDFLNILKEHLPIEEIDVADKLYDLQYSCGEIIFGSKDIIALNKILRLSDKKRQYVFSLINKDDIFPYIPTEGTYKNTIANNIKEFIDLVESNPKPIKLKMHGRSAICFKLFAYGSNDIKQALKDNEIEIFDVEDELKKLLLELKIQVIMDDKKLHAIWKWMYDSEIKFNEISEDDVYWASYHDINKKKNELTVGSILVHFIIKFCDLSPTSLNSWVDKPFSVEMDKISNIFATKGFTEFMSEKIYTKQGLNYLGILCDQANAKLNGV
jgi:hypothetical protein